MTTVLFAWIYFCLLGAVVVSITRAIRYARAPLHLRWELYPVPNRIGQARTMAAEILLLEGVRKANPKLWRVSYPFHSGLFLLIFTAVATILGIRIPYAARIGLILVTLGATGLLARRTIDPKLRQYTTAGDITNLLLFIVTAAALLLSGVPRAVITSLVHFDTAIQLSLAQSASLALAAGLILYIPTTHMAHFIAKYFTYHKVRWDDATNQSAAPYLGYQPTWSAPHIAGDGKTTWADIATKNPTAGGTR